MPGSVNQTLPSGPKAIDAGAAPPVSPACSVMCPALADLAELVAHREPHRLPGPGTGVLGLLSAGEESIGTCTPAVV